MVEGRVVGCDGSIAEIDLASARKRQASQKVDGACPCVDRALAVDGIVDRCEAGETFSGGHHKRCAQGIGQVKRAIGGDPRGQVDPRER